MTSVLVAPERRRLYTRERESRRESLPCYFCNSWVYPEAIFLHESRGASNHMSLLWCAERSPPPHRWSTELNKQKTKDEMRRRRRANNIIRKTLYLFTENYIRIYTRHYSIKHPTASEKCWIHSLGCCCWTDSLYR
jgi:hypothetical protein